MTRTRLRIADLLTASRFVVALVLAAGRPRAGLAVLLVAYAWMSDGLDGSLARSTGGNGRLARLDPVADVSVGLGVVWYLGAVGVVPAATTRVTAAFVIALWASTGVLAVQMLLQALAYGAFLWWAFAIPVVGRWLLPAVILVILAAEWRRFVSELVPRFLGGWRDLLAGRPRGDDRS